MSQSVWFLIGAALSCAGFVQGMSGFGFGLVSMSLLPVLVGIKQAAVYSTVFALLATIATFARHYRDYNWRLGALFLVCVCVGLPWGVFLLEWSSETVLTRIMGAFLLGYAVREFVTRGPAQPPPAASTVPWGLFSGALSGAFNLGGVPSAAYAYAQAWSRDQIMAFLQVMIALSCGLRMIFYRKVGLLGGLSWTNILLFSIPLYVAIWLGHVTQRRVEPRVMRKGVFVFVGLAGFYYLFLHHGTK